MTDERFLPAVYHQTEINLGASSRYWPTVWRRLRHDPQAILSLGLLIALVAAVLVGPWLWSVDPSQQYLNQISHPPVGASEAVVVDTFEPWSDQVAHDQAPNSATESPLIVEAANTEFVRLRWPVLPNAARFQIFRSDQQTAETIPGLPLATVNAPVNGYQDSLNLTSRKYRYRVIALDANEAVLDRWEVHVTPQLAISRYAVTLSQLPEQGVIAIPAHPLGTDHLGRDMLARMLEGGRTSLFIGLVAPLFYILFGVLYGATSALLGGRADAMMMNVVDFVIALPFLLFMILFRVAVGTEPGDSGITAMLVAMIALGWPSPARLVRGEILKLREMPYVEAARLMGAGRGYLITRHLLPNIMGSILVTFTFAIPSAIFAEAFLSFIGLGVVPPAPSWGAMCNDGLARLLTQPHIMLFPALAISLTVLIFNLLGDSLRDAMTLEQKG
ncbi:MAG: ABC transporter permease [Hahellaceae bacterium]|nr:ABC transporter permease [Hahellaceae bacterium]